MLFQSIPNVLMMVVVVVMVLMVMSGVGGD